jgi:TonB family protein
MLQIRNNDSVTLDCHLQMPAKFFPEMEQKLITRRYVLLPGAKKQPKIGFITGEVDAAATSLTCERVLQPSAATGTCTLEAPAGANPGAFYPKSAIKQNLQGTVVVAIVMQKSGVPSKDVEIEKSSGYPDLDNAGVEFVKATGFETNCIGEKLKLPVGFALR